MIEHSPQIKTKSSKINLTTKISDIKDRHTVKSHQHKTTLTDVAARAHVSPSTASKALADLPRVDSHTRQLVLKAARELNYRTPRERRKNEPYHTNTIGLITSDLQGRFSTPILIGAERELSAQGTSILLTNAQGNPLVERHHLHSLLRRDVDGLIILNADANPRAPLAANRDELPPTVYAYAPSTNKDDCSVTCDNKGAGKMAVDHLLSCGKSKIVLITGPRSYTAATDRVEGVQQELQRKNLSLVCEPTYGQWDESWGRGATRLLIEEKVDFDAIICGNDQIARGCIDALKQSRISIPAQVAVIGHDNWDILVHSSRPTLTSIDNNLEQIGSVAAHYLTDALNGHPHHGVTQISCRLIKRESTLPSS